MKNLKLWLNSFNWREVAIELARKVSKTSAAVLLALLMFVVVSGVILFSSRSTLSDSTFTLLFLVYMVFVAAIIMVFLIRLLPKNGEPKTVSSPVTEISGFVRLNDEEVAGARVRLLTATGASAVTDQDGLFRLLPVPAQPEWQIKADYESLGGSRYNRRMTVKPEQVRGKPITVELAPAADSPEEIILDKLSRLKSHIGKHRKCIEDTVAPLIDENNLVDTVQKFNELVEHHQPWSEPYSDLLYGRVDLKHTQLNNPKLQDSLKKAVTEVESFQEAAFVLLYQSFVQKTLLYDAYNLYEEYSRGSHPEDVDSLRNGVKTSMIESFKTLVSNEDRQHVFAQMPLDTPFDVREFVKAWCVAWKHKVQAADNHGFLRSAVTDFEAVIDDQFSTGR